MKYNMLSMHCNITLLKSYANYIIVLFSKFEIRRNNLYVVEDIQRSSNTLIH